MKSLVVIVVTCTILILAFLFAQNSLPGLSASNAGQNISAVSTPTSTPGSVFTQTPFAKPTIIAPPPAAPCVSPCGALALVLVALAIGVFRKP